MRTFYLGFFFIVVSSTSYNCKKETHLSVKNGTQLKTVVTLAKDSTGVTTLEYNNEGQLAAVVDSFSMLSDNGHYASLTFVHPIEYDFQERLIKVIYREGLGNDAVYDTIIYNDENEAIRRIFISELEKDTIIHVYSYDNEKRIIVDSAFNNKQEELIDYTTYSYDGNDNLVESNHYSNVSGILENIGSMQAIYDNKINPYEKLGTALFTFRRKEQVLSKNNIVQENYSDGTVVHYVYTYFDNDLPQEATITTISSNNTVVRNVEFFYE